LKFYVRADRLPLEVVKALRRIGTSIVFVGFESGSDEILRGIGKGITTEQNFQASRRLGQEGIKVEASFVVGLPGETEESLERTYQHAREIADVCDVEMCFANIIMPVPGSKIYERLVNSPYGSQYRLSDNPDLEEITRAYLQGFTHVGFETLQEFGKRLEQVGRLRGSHGYI